MADVLIKTSKSATPIRPTTEADVERLAGREKALAAAHQFRGKAGQMLIVSDEKGGVERVLVGVGKAADPGFLRGLSARLPDGDYRLEADLPDPTLAALNWSLGAYVFDRYRRRDDRPRPRLVAPKGADVAEVKRIASSCFLAREMVDTPASDMGPLQIETIARSIAEEHGASMTVTAGAALLEQNYPAVHAVGRAADPSRAPRMIELRWRHERKSAPMVALVGKGVVFDTGGLNLKPGAGMRNMKKDMGGAAHALALARMVMAADLPVRLAVLVPAVENAVSGDAFRPGDVLASRKGLTIEIGNTDAEGRLVLADALTRASEFKPDLTFDFATLTGAARIALGPELPPFYTGDDGLAAELETASRKVVDPIWRMPLWPGYGPALESDIADLRNDPAEWAQAGSVTAALFLQKFAPETGSWAHFDIFAWNPRSRPGWPVGGEAQVIRACFEVLKRRSRKGR